MCRCSICGQTAFNASADYPRTNPVQSAVLQVPEQDVVLAEARAALRLCRQTLIRIEQQLESTRLSLGKIHDKLAPLPPLPATKRRHRRTEAAFKCYRRLCKETTPHRHDG